MVNLNAQKFLEVYENLGIDVGNLGCIMLDTETIATNDIIADGDYFTRPSQYEDGMDDGHESEREPHVTLLYGLLRPGIELKKHVDAVLDGWQPQELIIDYVGFFYSTDAEMNAVTIVAFVRKTDSLLEANARLRFLPHIDTFPEYKPHITLAYVKDSANWQEYVTLLNDKYAGKSVKPVSINYGH